MIKLLLLSLVLVGASPIPVDDIVYDLLINNIDPYDPEYAALLAQVGVKHSRHKNTLLELQRQATAEVMPVMSLEDRISLIQNVRRYPFHRLLPEGADMLTPQLMQWRMTRRVFFHLVRGLK